MHANGMSIGCENVDCLAWRIPYFAVSRFVANGMLPYRRLYVVNVRIVQCPLCICVLI